MADNASEQQRLQKQLRDLEQKMKAKDTAQEKLNQDFAVRQKRLHDEQDEIDAQYFVRSSRTNVCRLCSSFCLLNVTCSRKPGSVSVRLDSRLRACTFRHLARVIPPHRGRYWKARWRALS